MDQVNAALDELNHYADLTIYNFTEMTRNIGTFTAAGVDLDTSVAAIKGIANLAAVSGSTSQQASTAMYQLSQALASGTVKLQDWNSVVNAGMGGQVFQDALKETARVHGVAIDSMIAKEGSFRETLSKGWLTSSILTETLQKFTGDLNEETLKSIGYTDEQIKKIMEMGKTANDAATKVKTFSQLKDTLAEALQSGWTQTWQTVIGDFEEAKELFTKFSDVFSDLINKSSEARNTVLEGGLNSGWQQLRTALGDSADFYSQMLEKVMLANGSISQKQIDDAGSFAKALQQGGVSAEQLQNGLDESTQQLQALSKLSDKELMAKGLDPTQVTAENYPAVEWTTPEAKHAHIGDLYYDKSTGIGYRWTENSGGYYWDVIEDKQVQQALNNASRAQSTADGKVRCFSAQPYPPYEVGDLWVQGGSGDILCCQHDRESGSYVASDWVRASKYTDDTKAIEAGKTATDYIKDGAGGVQVGPNGSSNVTMTDEGLVFNGIRNLVPLWENADPTSGMAGGTVICSDGRLASYAAIAIGCQEYYTSPFDSASTEGGLIQYTIVVLNGKEARCSYAWDKPRARKVTASKNGITFGPGGYYDTKKLDKWIWPWTDVTYGAKFDAHNQCCVPVVVYGFL